MPYKTIQQNFANGELNPKMQGRSDVDMYYKSAQKMRDVVTTPYGGFVRRPGSVNLYRGADGLRKIENLTASTQLTAEAEHPVSNILDGSKETYFKANGTLPVGTSLLTITDPLESGTTEKTYYAYDGGQTYYAWKTSYEAGAFFSGIFTKERHPNSSTTFYYYYNGEMKDFGNDIKFKSYDKNTNVISVVVYTGLGQYGDFFAYSKTDNKKINSYPVYVEKTTPEIGDPIYSDTNGTLVDYVEGIEDNSILGAYNDYPRFSEKDVTITVESLATPKKVSKVAIYGIKSNSDLTVFAGSKEIAKIKAKNTKQNLFFDTEIEGFNSLYFYKEQEGNLEIELEEVEVFYEGEKSIVRLFPFVFNNQESYLLSVTNKIIRVFRNDELVSQIDIPYFTYDIIKTIRYAQTADTAIFVHPEIRPIKLERNQNTEEWKVSIFNLETIPYHNFEQKDPKKYEIDITPDNMEGTVKFSFTGTISENVVGQYLEGNGGRLKITKQEKDALIGYTVIGFYTRDVIKKNDWSITTNYEPVWSDTRGWPSSVTFHQGRLWFGGSKERPQTVWGSKVGLFNKFDPTGGYDNDAIEFTLDTESLNKITDIYSAKGLYIFTLGGEFVCQTSYGEPITPKNVSALKQSSNGSWENTQPVELEGSVIFVERKGQALMNFAYLTEEDYATSNASLVNSHLINQPEDLDVERNNLTQQTNYVYIVNKDGSMCVVNLLAAQGITGGFTLWNTQGKVKSVCVLPDATYIAVERNAQTSKPIYIEKLDWNNLTDNAKVVTLNEATQFTVPHLAGNTVDVLCDGKFVGKYKADEEGLIVFSKPLTGKVEIGLPFRSYVQSNFLEVAQMGSGVGKLKRLASMVVRVLDTPEVTINGETQKGTGKGVEDIHFYGIGDWDEKPTWEFTQNTPYKFNVLAAQMDLNYQLSTESY